MTTRSAIYSGTAAPLRARTDWNALADLSGPTPGRCGATRRPALWLGGGIQPRRLAAGPVAGQEPARPLSNPTPGPGASPATRRGAKSRATARDRSAPGPQLSGFRALRKRKPGPQDGGDPGRAAHNVEKYRGAARPGSLGGPPSPAAPLVFSFASAAPGAKCTPNAQGGPQKQKKSQSPISYRRKRRGGLKGPLMAARAFPPLAAVPFPWRARQKRGRYAASGVRFADDETDIFPFRKQQQRGFQKGKISLARGTPISYRGNSPGILSAYKAELRV